MLSAADGNVSLRLSDDEILITPSGVTKAFMSPEEMACVRLSGEVVYGTPSSEVLMHLEVYKSTPKALSVIHAHPPHGIAWSISHPQMSELPSEAMSELILACGRIPIVPFALPGTLEMAKNLLPYLPQYRILILARHGGLSWGESLNEAYRGMERLEHSAQILSIAHGLGGITNLAPETVEKLRSMRLKIEEKTGGQVL